MVSLYGAVAAGGTPLDFKRALAYLEGIDDGYTLRNMADASARGGRAMKCEGFTPAEPVRLRHRLALADLQIRWDSDGEDDAILGILPILGHFAHELITTAAYDLSISVEMIGDDHPRLRPVCRRISRRLKRFGLGA